MNYLDDASDVLLEVGGLWKQGYGNSSDGRALVVDARYFVDGYVVMIKNGGLKVIKVKFGDTQNL